MSEQINYSRRRVLGTATAALAALQLGVSDTALAADALRVPAAPFGPIRQINAGLLNVGYVEIGPADGRPVILLHGWP